MPPLAEMHMPEAPPAGWQPVVPQVQTTSARLAASLAATPHPYSPPGAPRVPDRERRLS